MPFVPDAPLPLLELLQVLGGLAPQRGLYLIDGFSSPAPLLPYASFPARVAASAAHFRAQGIQPGEHVLLPFDTDEGVLFSFLGLIELGAIPLSVKPFILSTPRGSYLEFLGKICERYGVHKVLDAPSLRGLEPPRPRVPLVPLGARVEGARLRQAQPEELAFVQFSSGSTSFPKGVPITHRNLALSLWMMARHGQHQPGATGVVWLPLYHDMGLLGSLTCMVLGIDLHLAQPATFLMDPVGWLEFMSQRRATLTIIPNFAIDYALKPLGTLEPEELAQLELSSLRTIYLGSEPINIPNLERFTQLLAPRGFKREAFKPCYGMAEAVLMVSSVEQDKSWRVATAPNGRTVISVGPVLKEFEVRLRTEDGRLCAERELGEIEIKGGSLASSYYVDERPMLNAEGFYPTGDVGFLQEGELFITGRVSDRFKINGQSYFSSDFEQAIERLPFIRAGRSAVIQSQGRVVVLAEAAYPSALEPREPSQRQVCARILETVGVSVAPQDVLFIRYGQIPKTSSGKLQRRALTEAYEQGRIRVATPRQLRADLLKMRAQRLFYGVLSTVRTRGSRWLKSVRAAR